jgi:carbonic anhydrase
MASSFPQHLLDGYRAFTSQRLPTEQSRYKELSERGQSPAVMVIGCCDSRVSPEVIFDAGPGELFVVRIVANLVPVYEPVGGAHGG